MLGQFWKRSAPTTAVLEPEVINVPARVKPQPTMVGEVELAEYITLAAKVGFAPAELLYHRLMHFFLENNIDVYDMDSVEKYLDKLFGKAGEYASQITWGWRPLRPEDDGQVTDDKALNENGQIFRGRYNQIVPAPILMTVDSITTAFPETDPKMYFFVSDKARPSDKKDPFVCIKAPGMRTIIFERFNEPGYCL